MEEEEKLASAATARKKAELEINLQLLHVIQKVTVAEAQAKVLEVAAAHSM